MGPEETKFHKWLDRRKKDDLVDMHVTYNPSWRPENREEVFAVLNRVNEAADHRHKEWGVEHSTHVWPPAPIEEV